MLLAILGIPWLVAPYFHFLPLSSYSILSVFLCIIFPQYIYFSSVSSLIRTTSYWTTDPYSSIISTNYICRDCFQVRLHSQVPGGYRPFKALFSDVQHHSSSEKCKSKPQWDTVTCQSEWLLSKSPQAINALEGVEKREHSFTVVGWS